MRGKHLAKHGGQVLLLRWRMPRKIQTMAWEGLRQGGRIRLQFPMPQEGFGVTGAGSGGDESIAPLLSRPPGLRGVSSGGGWHVVLGPSLSPQPDLGSCSPSRAFGFPSAGLGFDFVLFRVWIPDNVTFAC